LAEINPLICTKKLLSPIRQTFLPEKRKKKIANDQIQLQEIDPRSQQTIILVVIYTFKKV
jgi:hypothetical protein